MEDRSYNEKELLSRMAEGDEQAYMQIIDRYGSIIYGHSLLYVKDVPLAEEVTQDILFNLWKQRTMLAEVENFPGYVYAMTRKRAFTAFRTKLAAYADAPPDHLASALNRPDASLEFKQLSQAILNGIEHLPPRRKQIFIMSRYDGLTYDAIANQLGIAKSTVKDHILEALVFLRTYIKENSDVVLMTMLWLNMPSG